MIVKVMLMLLAIFGGIYAQNIPTVEWESHSVVPFEMFAGGFVVCDDALYSLGGSSNKGQLRTAFKYEPATNEWTQQTSMPTKRMNAAYVSINGKIHVIAGDSFLDVHEVYDPSTDEWSPLAPIPTNVQHVKGVASGGKIYVMGGLESWFIVSNKNQVYDIETDTWLEMAPMPIGKHNYSSTVYDGKIYVFGGGVYDVDDKSIWGLNSSIEVYDIKTDTWTSMGNMPTSLFYSGIVVYGDEIIILGGFRETEVPEARVDIFSLNTHTWRKGLPLPIGLAALGALEYNGQLYVSGGSDSSSTWIANRNLYQISIKKLLENMD